MKRILTNSETKVMNALWSFPDGEGRGMDVVKACGEPRPAQTTVLTFLRILTNKGYVTPRREGRGYIFRPTVSKDEYRRIFLEHTKRTLFDDSSEDIVKFMIEQGLVSRETLRQLAEY